MFEFINRIIKAANRYTFWDYFFLKTTVLVFGILIGTYFASFFIDHTLFLWLVFLVTYVYIMYRTFIKHMKRDSGNKVMSRHKRHPKRDASCVNRLRSKSYISFVCDQSSIPAYSLAFSRAFSSCFSYFAGTSKLLSFSILKICA